MSDAPATPRLLADIGGTHARFALQTPGARPGAPVVLDVADHADLEHAAGAALARLAPSAPPRVAALAVAGPIVGETIAMTNHPWKLSRAAIARALGLDRVEIVNDFAAVARALPHLAADEHRPIGDGPEKGAPRATLATIGPGTGLGIAGLTPAGAAGGVDAAMDARGAMDTSGGWVVVAGEGGHADFAAVTTRERAVRNRLAARHGHVSIERVLSGPGLGEIYRALAEINGRDSETPPPDAAEIAARARARSDAIAVETAALFSAALGGAAGNLALTLGARGGVYLAGGVVPGLGAAFDETAFRRRFVAKGRFKPYLAAIPTELITTRWPALTGLAALLDTMPPSR